VKTLHSVLHAILPSVETAVYDAKLGFRYFAAIGSLYDEGVTLPKQEGISIFRTLFPQIMKAAKDTTDNFLLFENPEMIDRMPFLTFILIIFIQTVPLEGY
jgi:lipoxygenase